MPIINPNKLVCRSFVNQCAQTRTPIVGLCLYSRQNSPRDNKAFKNNLQNYPISRSTCPLARGCKMFDDIPQNSCPAEASHLALNFTWKRFFNFSVPLICTLSFRHTFMLFCCSRSWSSFARTSFSFCAKLIGGPFKIQWAPTYRLRSISPIAKNMLYKKHNEGSTKTESVCMRI